MVNFDSMYTHQEKSTFIILNRKVSSSEGLKQLANQETNKMHTSFSINREGIINMGSDTAPNY